MAQKESEVFYLTNVFFAGKRGWVVGKGGGMCIKRPGAADDVSPLAYLTSTPMCRVRRSAVLEGLTALPYDRMIPRWIPLRRLMAPLIFLETMVVVALLVLMPLLFLMLLLLFLMLLLLLVRLLMPLLL